MSDSALASLLFLGVAVVLAAVVAETLLALVVVVGIGVLPVVLALTLAGNLVHHGFVGVRERGRRRPWDGTSEDEAAAELDAVRGAAGPAPKISPVPGER